MPKDRIGSPVTIFPLYETNSLYSSIKVSHWLAKLFKSSGAIPQS